MLAKSYPKMVAILPSIRSWQVTVFSSLHKGGATTPSPGLYVLEKKTQKKK
jgi:hypothetical protein